MRSAEKSTKRREIEKLQKETLLGLSNTQGEKDIFAKVAALSNDDFHRIPELGVDGYCNRQIRWMFMDSGSYRTFISQCFFDKFKENVKVIDKTFTAQGVLGEKVSNDEIAKVTFQFESRELITNYLSLKV